MNNLNDLLSRIETAGLWSFFHKDWLLQIRTLLRSQLPNDYHVFVESEAVVISAGDIESPKSAVLPDIAVVRRTPVDDRKTSVGASQSTSQAVIEVDEPVELETHYSLLIRLGPAHVVVPALEMLSPSNKGLGNRWDRKRHLRKRAEFLDCGISLLELDPLLKGVRDLPSPLARLSEYDHIGWSAYHQEGRRQYRGWGWNQADSLPQIDWQIDAEQRPVINLTDYLRTAADFNDWTSLVSGIK